MALATYADLQAAIADHLARPDLPSFIPDFIRMAEDWLNYGSDQSAALRTREMQETASVTLTGGSGALPSDYLEYIEAREANRGPLAYLTPDQASRMYPTGPGGVSGYFSIDGTSIDTFPQSTGPLSLSYYAAIPNLSDSNTTNWLLLKSPGIYLRASLAQAALFIKDDAEFNKQVSAASSLISGLNRSDMLGKYSRTGIAIRGATP